MDEHGHADAAGREPELYARRYDSFVVRIWSERDDPTHILRAEVRHVQSAQVRVARNIGYPGLAALIFPPDLEPPFTIP